MAVEENDGGVGERNRIQSLDQIHMDLDEYDGLEQDDVQGWLNRSLDKPNDSIKDAITALRRGTTDGRPSSVRNTPQVSPRASVAPSSPRGTPPLQPATPGMPPLSPRTPTPHSAGRPSPRSVSKPSAIPRPSPRTPKPSQTPRTVPFVEAAGATPITEVSPLSSQGNAGKRSRDAPSTIEPASPGEEQARREREAMARIYDPFLNEQRRRTEHSPSVTAFAGNDAGLRGFAGQQVRTDEDVLVQDTVPPGDESPETSFAGGQHVRTGSWPALGMIDAAGVDSHTPYNNGSTYLQSNALFTAAQQLSNNTSPREGASSALNGSSMTHSYVTAGLTPPASSAQTSTNIPVATMDSNSMYKTLMANVQMLVQAIHHKKAKEDQQLNYLNHLVQSTIPPSGARESPEWSPFGPTPRGSAGTSQVWHPSSPRVSTTGSNYNAQHQPTAVSNTSASLEPWQAHSGIFSANSSFFTQCEIGGGQGQDAVGEMQHHDDEVPPTPRHLAGDYSMLVPNGEMLDQTSFYSAHNQSTASSLAYVASSSPMKSTPRDSENGYQSCYPVAGGVETQAESGWSSLNASVMLDNSRLSASTSLLPPPSVHESVELSQTYQFMLDEAHCAAENTAPRSHVASRSPPVGGGASAGNVLDSMSSYFGISRNAAGYRAMQSSDFGSDGFPSALSRSASAIPMWSYQQDNVHRSDVGGDGETLPVADNHLSTSSPELAVFLNDSTATYPYSNAGRRMSEPVSGRDMNLEGAVDSPRANYTAEQTSASEFRGDNAFIDEGSRPNCISETGMDRSDSSRYSQQLGLLDRADDEDESEQSTSTGTVIVREDSEEESEDGSRPLTVGHYSQQPPLCPTPRGATSSGFLGRRQGHSRATSHAHSRRSTSSTVDCASTGRALSLIDMAEPLTSSIDLAAGLLSNDFDDEFLDRALPDADIERASSGGALAAFLKSQALPELHHCSEPALPAQEELETSLGNVLESLLVGGEVTSSGLPVVREQSPRATQNTALAKKVGEGGDLVSVSVDTTDGTSALSPRDIAALVKGGGSRGGSPTKRGAIPAELTRLQEESKGTQKKMRRPGFLKRLFSCHCAYFPEETF